MSLSIVDLTESTALHDAVKQDVQCIPTINELIEINKRTFDKWQGSVEETISVFGTTPAPEYLQALSNFCLNQKIPLDLHILETMTQRVHSDLEHGKSFVKYLAEIWALKSNTTLIHLVWVDDEDMNLIAAADAVVAHCPIAEVVAG